MKLNTATKQVTRSEGITESKFKIAASAKAFDILSSKLYEDVPKAIVRELSTNAYDAHVVAGHLEKPFEVSFPNMMNPMFKIRDFGTGLAPKDIEDLYTTYFASDKTDSNDFTGMLGLGSKSPYAYTQNFAVNDYYNGKLYSYSMFTDEEGIPVVSRLGETETSEPNGLEISFAVKPQDFRAFIIAGESVYQHFSIKPIIKGQRLNIKEQTNPELSGPDWKIFERNTWRQGENIIVTMGNVGYPVSSENLTLGPNTKLLFEYRIIIEAPIGSVNITASREGLHYDKPTVKWLEDKLINIASTIISDSVKQIKQCKTYWEAYIKKQELEGDGNSFRTRLLRLSPVQWRGKKIDHDIKLNFVIEKFSPHNGNYSYKTHNWKTVISRDKLDFIRPRKDIILFVNNLKRGAIKSAQEYARENNQEIYLIEEENLEEFLKTTEIPRKDIKNISDHYVKPVITRVKKNSGVDTKKKFFILDPTKYDGWTNKEFDLDEGDNIYIDIYRWKSTLQGRGVGYKELLPVRNFLRIVFKDPDLEIVGIKKKEINKVEKKKNWIPLEDKIEEAAEIIRKDKVLALLMTPEKRARYYYRPILESINLNNRSGIGKAIRRYKEWETEKSELIGAINALPYYTKHSLNISYHEKNFLDKIEEVVRNRYPLLKYIDTYNLKSSEVEEYIELIDQKRKDKKK